MVRMTTKISLILTFLEVDSIDDTEESDWTLVLLYFELKALAFGLILVAAYHDVVSSARDDA